MSGLSFILAHQIIIEYTDATLANCETVVHRRYTLNRSESETPLLDASEYSTNQIFLLGRRTWNEKGPKF